MSANHVLLQRLEVTNSTSTIVSFRNIPQTGYTDLKIVVSGRTVRSGTDRSNDFLLTFNDSASGYSRKDLGDSPVRSTGGSSLSNIGRIQMPSDDATANTFGNAEIYIANYTSSQNKAVTIDNVSQDNNTYGPTWLVAGLWSSSTPVYSISLTADQSGTITAGSTFSLYGIAKLGTAPVIAPKATGGDIIANDGEYWYHAFLSTGAFKPRTNLNADMIIVGAGGSGGTDVGGGAGAGRVYALSNNIFANSVSYTCTIGAGAPSPQNVGGAQQGTKGGDSSVIGGLISYISLGGGGGNSRSGSPSTLNDGWNGGGGSYDYNTRPETAGNGGYAGGATLYPNSNPCYCGGGGGTVEAGNTDGTGQGGDGTNAYYSWHYATNTGVNGYIAGGGGGGMYGSSTSNSTGGEGGGGLGGDNDQGGGNGVANTGSGGGGAGSSQNGGAGGSGLIIIRYAMA